MAKNHRMAPWNPFWATPGTHFGAVPFFELLGILAEKIDGPMCLLLRHEQVGRGGTVPVFFGQGID